MSAARSSRDELLLTCEHGGNRIPSGYAELFRGAEEVLASHRGWDPGALTLARHFARTLRRPVHAVTWSRLFVEERDKDDICRSLQIDRGYLRVLLHRAKQRFRAAFLKEEYLA